MIDSSKWMSPAPALFLPTVLLMVIATTTAGAPIHGTSTESKGTGSSLTTKKDDSGVKYPAKTPNFGRSGSPDPVFPPAKTARDLKTLEPARLDPHAFEAPERLHGGDGASGPSIRVDSKTGLGSTSSEKSILYGNGNLEPDSSALDFSSSAGNEGANNVASDPNTLKSGDTLDYDFDEPPAPWPAAWNYAIAVVLLGSAMVIALCVIAFRHLMV